MNRRLCYFGFFLLLLAGCISVPINTPQRDTAQEVNKVFIKDSASNRVIIEPPYISADSLAMMRELWDSIFNYPYSRRGGFITEDKLGRRVAVCYEDSYGVTLVKTVDHPFAGRKYNDGVYWRGTKELPANYMVSDSTAHLFQLVDNMPQFPGKGGDRNFYDTREIFNSKLTLKGDAVVRFVVEADGTVSNAHVIQGSTPREDYFARVIATYLLRFTPPTHRGKPCRVVYQLEL